MNMKKLLWILLATTFLLYGCGDDGDKMPGAEFLEEGETSLIASIEQFVTTRLTFSERKGTWEKGDEIAVYCTNGTFVYFRLVGIGGTARALFAGKIPEGYSLGNIAFWGPKEYLKKLDGNNLHVNLPTDYQIPNGEIPALMVAGISEGDNTIEFKHMCGFLKITVSNVPVKTSKLIVKADGKNLAGEYICDVRNGEAGITISNGNVPVTCSFTEVGNKISANIPVPIGRYQNLSFMITDNEDKELIRQNFEEADFVVSRGSKQTVSAVCEQEVERSFITICGVNWALGNLMYDEGNGAEGFQPGWRLGYTQWEYFHYDEGNDASEARQDVAMSEAGYDHFNFGGIEDALSNSTGSYARPDDYEFNIQGKMYVDQQCTNETNNYDAARYGDIAYWASKGICSMPTKEQLKTLYNVASFQFGYIVTSTGCRVYGVLFTNPDEERITNNEAKEFTEADLESGLFLPRAGRRAKSNDGTVVIHTRTQGVYWSSTTWAQKPADAGFTSEYSTYLWIHPNPAYQIDYGYTMDKNCDRSCGFSIRPIVNLDK